MLKAIELSKLLVPIAIEADNNEVVDGVDDLEPICLDLKMLINCQKSEFQSKFSML